MTFSEEKKRPAPGLLAAGTGRHCPQSVPGALRAAAAGAAGLLFFVIGFREPYSSDEFWFLVKAWDFLGSGSLDGESMIHPPLYLLLTSGLVAAFDSPLAARLTGLLCCASAALLIKKAGEADGDARRAAAAAAMLVLSPAFIKAALVLDTDNTLITLGAAAMALAAVRERRFLLSPIFFFCLWSKLTACVPLAAAFLVHAAWEDRRSGGGRTRSTALALSAGLAAWALAFYLFCMLNGLPFAAPFEYMYSAVFSKSVAPASAYYQVLQAALWAGLPLCGLFLLGLPRTFTGTASSLDRLSLSVCAIIGVGYIFVGGTPFGFPKFQIPAWPFICWLAAGAALKAPGPALWAAAAAALALYAGDPLYSLRFSLREALASGADLSLPAAKLAAQLALPLLPAAAAAVLFRKTLGARRALAAGLTAVFVGQSLALNALQAGSYNSAYNYGGKGLAGAAALAGEALKDGGKVIAPLEIYGTLRLSGLKPERLPNSLWERDRLLAAAADADYKGVVYGIPSNTVEQVRLLRHPGTVSLFGAEGWRFERRGTYEIWTR
ncbi:MAG: hypothetical protein FD189_748 [Elusimicrobia bacterium]|nr:MAG: hypothetical protein FD154_679 [Elusimicrobiota bacterium]KAF0156994.1 MAG: hypothetical protein FD189_748 [Elusimicrobiota bacterium]